MVFFKRNLQVHNTEDLDEYITGNDNLDITVAYVFDVTAVHEDDFKRTLENLRDDRDFA
jgi:hypothetical protein